MSVNDHATLAILWQLEHSGPMRTSHFLNLLIADAVPYAVVTCRCCTESRMSIKYVVTLIQIVPNYTDETHVCRLIYIYIFRT